MSELISNPELELAGEYVEQTGSHLFLTGKAGTGKTTFLRQLQASTSKRLIVTAPTGVAALNAGGVTLHSFFQLPFGPILPDQQQQASYRFSKDKVNIIKSLDLLVIDEVSMVRADMLDGIDSVLRRFRKKEMPFGGVQLLLIGDLHQLPPVVKANEWSLLSRHYVSPYFFNSLALQQSGFVSIELQTVYRQSQARFIDLLNAVRDARWTPEVLNAINEQYCSPDEIKDTASYITLTTHNSKAEVINRENLNRLSGTPEVYTSTVEGDFPENIFPVEAELTLKVGARVMFTRNDPSEEKQYYNGKIGTVEKLQSDSVVVCCDEGQQLIRIEPALWENTQYTVNEQNNEIEANILGSFTQIPLRLAWAITIHKSQGLTFERAVIDAQDAFASGQIYVALSRCRSLEGLILSSRVASPSYEADDLLQQFDQHIESNKPDHTQMLEAKRLFQYQLLAGSFDFTKEKQALYRWLNACKRATNVVSNVTVEDMLKQIDAFETSVVKAASKFNSPLQRYCASGIPADNEELNQRLVKAGHYMVEQLTPLWEMVNGFQFELDNKAERKQIRQSTEHVHESLHIKREVFQSLSTGFDPSRLLKAKALASLSKLKTPASVTKVPAFSEADIPFPELFETLKKWRKETADELGMPAYTVLHQKALIQIVCHLPDSLDSLLALAGIGPMTVDKYGEPILNMVAEFCKEKSIDPTVSRLGLNKGATLKSLAGQKQRPQKTTYLVTLELFQNGLSIEDIANQRGLVVSTIEKHLTQAVEQGELTLNSLIQDVEKIERIRAQITSVEGFTMKPVKEALGETVRYAEIAWVLAEMKSIEGSKPNSG